MQSCHATGPHVCSQQGRRVDWRERLRRPRLMRVDRFALTDALVVEEAVTQTAVSYIQ